MALYHVRVRVFSKLHRQGGSARMADYIARTYSMESGRATDLVETGYGALPAWAKSPTHFFQMADRYERQNATLARDFEIALPRELDARERSALAADIRETFFARFPHTYALHTPIDRHGQEYPHMHLMLSERRETDGYERGPKQYFSRAAGPDQDPARHGVRKDRSFHGRPRLHELREGIATLTNAALERAGHAVAVSARSHAANGFARPAATYRLGDSATVKAQVEARREVLHRDYHPWEQELHRAAWAQQKQREGIVDLSREAMVAYVRERFWGQEQPPQRERAEDGRGAQEQTMERRWAIGRGDEMTHGVHVLLDRGHER